MTYWKITEGYVEQVFDDKGNCISQCFVAGTTVHYETDDGSFVTTASAEDCPDIYHPFDMVQPEG